MPSYSFKTHVKVLYYIRNAPANMQEKIPFAAGKFKVPERTIRRWISDGDVARKEFEKRLSTCERKRKVNYSLSQNVVT